MLLSLLGLGQLPVVPLQKTPVPSLLTPPAGMAIWLKPETITTNANNTALSFWPDSSGNNHNFGGNVTWSNNILNGYGVATANGSLLLTGTNSLSVTRNIPGGSLFVVMRIVTASTFNTPVTFFAGTTFQRYSFTTTGSSQFSWQGRTLDGDSVSTVGTLGSNPTNFFLAEAVVDYTAGKVTVWTNGVLVQTASPLTHGNTSNTDSSSAPRWPFDGGGGSGKYQGVELLFYASAVSDPVRTGTIEPYFRNKYLLW